MIQFSFHPWLCRLRKVDDHAITESSGAISFDGRRMGGGPGRFARAVGRNSAGYAHSAWQRPCPASVPVLRRVAGAQHGAEGHVHRARREGGIPIPATENWAIAPCFPTGISSFRANTAPARLRRTRRSSGITMAPRGPRSTPPIRWARRGCSSCRMAIRPSCSSSIKRATKWKRKSFSQPAVGAGALGRRV